MNQELHQQTRKRTPFGAANTNLQQSLSQSVKEFQEKFAKCENDKENTQISSIMTRHSTSISSSTSQKSTQKYHCSEEFLGNLRQSEDFNKASKKSNVIEDSNQEWKNSYEDRIDESFNEQYGTQLSKPDSCHQAPIQPAQPRALPQYSRQSAVYKCLQNAIKDLICEDHDDNEVTLFCGTCQTLLCDECLQYYEEHENHDVLNIHQFMDAPVLSFLNKNSVLRDVVWQSGQLLSKVKEEADSSIRVLKDFLDSIKEWVRKQSEKIERQFEKEVNNKVDGISKYISSIQSISTVYKNEWDNWLGGATVNSKRDLEQTCKQFLESSDNPKEALSNNCDGLTDLLHSIPELDINSFKELYLWLTDDFKLSYDMLVVQKTTLSTAQSYKNECNSKQVLKEELKALEIRKELEKISREFSKIEEMHKENEFKAEQLIELDDNKFLAIDNTHRIGKFFSGEGICLNTIQREERDEVNHALLLKDAKNLIICSSNWLEVFSMTSGRSLWRNRLHCLKALELPRQRIAVSDTLNNITVYSVVNVKNLEKLASVNIQGMFATQMTYQMVPSFTKIMRNDNRIQLNELEIIAIASNQQFTSKFAKEKQSIQIIDANSLQVILILNHKLLENGVSQLSFVKKINFQDQEEQKEKEEKSYNLLQDSLEEKQEVMQTLEDQYEEQEKIDLTIENTKITKRTSNILKPKDINEKQGKGNTNRGSYSGRSKMKVDSENTNKKRDIKSLKKDIKPSKILETIKEDTSPLQQILIPCQIIQPSIKVTDHRLKIEGIPKYLLIVLTLNSDILIYDLEKSIQPVKVFSLIENIGGKVSQFQVFDSEKIVYILGQSIYAASISLSTVIGTFCTHSIEGTVLTDFSSNQEKQDEEEKQQQLSLLDSLNESDQEGFDNKCTFKSNSFSTPYFSDLLVLRKQQTQGKVSILTSKVYPSKNQTCFEVISQ